MNFRKAISLVCLCLACLCAGVRAQAPASTSAAPDNTPAGTLAVFNGQVITLSDIDPKVRQMIESLPAEIANARHSVLDSEIDSILLEVEANKHGQTARQLYEAEVTSRIATPGEQDVSAFYESNRAQMGGADLATARPQIISYLRSQQEQKLAADLSSRLRATNNVVMGTADVNSPFLAPGAVLATAAGRPVTAGQVAERLKPVIFKLRQNVYEAEKGAVDQTINDLLLLAEARRRNIGPEDIIRSEITEKMRHATDDDVKKYYEENKALIKGDLASSRAEIVAYLDRQEQERLEHAFSDRLRTGVSIRLTFTEPEPPVQKISAEGGAARGDVNSSVTVVEFTDFQCPACGKMYPVLEQALKPYGDRVRFVIRNFPLDQHAFARKAAEAAAAANAQGKFFPYIDLLFHNQEALDVPSLKKYATAAGLDRARFDAELDKGVYAAAIDRDRKDGITYGIDSTPTIFINGVRLQDLSVDGVKTAVDRALARSGQSPARAAK